MPKKRMIVDVLVSQAITYRVEVEAESIVEAEKYVSDPDYCCDPRNEDTELLVIWKQYVSDVSFDDGSNDDDLPLLEEVKK